MARRGLMGNEVESPEMDAPGMTPVSEEVHEKGWQWRPVKDGAFAPPFGTIRVCTGCGALVAGGPTRCVRCVDAHREAVEEPDETGDRYSILRQVLADAVEQAAAGKGSERHDPNAERFEDQQIVQLCEWMGSNHGDIFQACKKAVESSGMPYERARAELLGAINYLAAAVIVLDRAQGREQHQRPRGFVQVRGGEKRRR